MSNKQPSAKLVNRSRGRDRSTLKAPLTPKRLPRPSRQARLVVKETAHGMLTADPAYSIPQIMFFANAAGYRYLAKLASWLADWASAPEHRKHVDSFTMGRGREIELADDSDEVLLRFIVAGGRASETARTMWGISAESAKKGDLRPRMARLIRMARENDRDARRISKYER